MGGSTDRGSVTFAAWGVGALSLKRGQAQRMIFERFGGGRKCVGKLANALGVASAELLSADDVGSAATARYEAGDTRGMSSC